MRLKFRQNILDSVLFSRMYEFALSNCFVLQPFLQSRSEPEQSKLRETITAGSEPDQVNFYD